MDQRQDQLHDYVSSQLQQGMPVGQLYEVLLSAGWPQAMIEKAVDEVFATSTHVSAQALPVPNPNPYVDPYQQPALSQQPAQQPQPLIDPPKYRVFQAIFDAIGAIKANVLQVILSIVIGYGLAAACIVIFVALTAGSAIIGIPLWLYSQSPTSMLIISAVIFVGTFVITSALGTLIISMTSLAIYAGAERRRQPFGEIFKHAVRSIWRVTLANLLFGIVVVGPLLASSLIMLVFFFAMSRSGSNGNMFAILSPLTALAATVWMVIALLRYPLASIVVLFEPQLPVRHSLRRSYHLLRNGGQWFIFKGFLLAVFIMLIVAIISGSADLDELQSSDNTVVNVVMAILSIIMTGVLVLLYRNRRAIKG